MSLLRRNVICVFYWHCIHFTDTSYLDAFIGHFWKIPLDIMPQWLSWLSSPNYRVIFQNYMVLSICICQIALVFQIILSTSDLRCNNLFLLRATDARIQRMISLFYWSTSPLLLRLNSSGVVFWIDKVVLSPSFQIRQVF